jgi:GT2 family glycosyltransferase
MSSFPLVSVIIPCYNAERWVREAIQSCLDQTYRPLEIIVIDDGSTDGSLAVIKSFGDAVRWETGPNRGGCAARNRGMALSRGRYIQFLDADDYILPQKIEHQVSHLEATGADGVYGDWQYKIHQPDGSVIPCDPGPSGSPRDLLAGLLSNEWWVACHALLWDREAILCIGGWDEHLEAGQDRDFFLTMALVGARVEYQPGCCAIYRRYGPLTVSTTNYLRGIHNHARLIEKAEVVLMATGRLTSHYRKTLAYSHFVLARVAYDLDHTTYQALLQKALALQPNLKPEVSFAYNSLQALFGYEMADMIASQRRQLLKIVTYWRRALLSVASEVLFRR